MLAAQPFVNHPFSPFSLTAMRFKLTIVLLLANLAVFFALWRLDRPVPITLKPSGLIDFQPDHITIKDNVKNEVRELVHDAGGAWRLVKPVEWAADEIAVQHLINRLVKPDELSHFSSDDISSTANPLGEYGLDKPRVEVTASGPNNKKIALLIGNSTPAGDNLYVMNPADHQVRVWRQEFFDIVETPVTELRDTDIFSLSFFDIQSLAIKSPKLVKFSRDSRNNDNWQLDTPLQRPADSLQVNKVVRQLRELKAQDFLPSTETNLARLGLASPSLSVELKTDNHSQTLLLGDQVPNTASNPQYYAKRSDNAVIFTVAPGDLVDTLRQAQEKLRERRFVDFTPDKITGITLRVFDAELRLLKSEGGANPWHIQARDAASKQPAPTDADKQVVLSLLENLRGLTAKGFTSDAPDDLKSYGLAPPTWKVTLEGDKSPVNLDIGSVPATATTPARYYAKVENADSVYEIDGDIIGDLSQGIDPLYFRDRVLERLPATAQITSLKLTRLKDDGSADGEPVFDFTADSTRSLDDQLKDKPESLRRNIQTLRDWLKSATVDGYLKASFDEHTPFPLVQGDSRIPVPAPWRYRLDVGVQIPAAGQTPAQSQTLTFYFTEQIGAHQYGGTHTPEVVFDLPISVISLLGALTRNVSLPPGAAETLNLQEQPIDPHAPANAPTATASPAPAAATALPAAGPASPAPAATP